MQSRIVAAFFWISFAGVASAQFELAVPSRPWSGAGAPPPPGVFLGGADDCASAVPISGGGVIPFDLTSATTGTTGQTEALCYASGTTGIDSDVWFEWTAAFTGSAELETCGLTSVDTKVAIYPGGGCPSPGTALACDDDACGLSSSVSWGIGSGASYMIQLGTYPGGSTGSGSFELTELPAVCGISDDGTSENALGLTAGGELGWMINIGCLICLDSVEVAYGSPMFPGAIANGRSSRVAVYEDCDVDLDPTTNTVLLEVVTTTVTNANTDVLNVVMLPTRVQRFTQGGHSTWVLASAEHLAGEFPAPMDTDHPTDLAWIVGEPGGQLDLADLSRNQVPPQRAVDAGFPTTWLLRGEQNFTCASTGQLLCFGDGTGAACGCGNFVEPCARLGCINSTGTGARLTGAGSSSVTNDTLVLNSSGLPNGQPGLFFQGDTVIAGGAGTTFGDGIRCCGTNIVRVEIAVSGGGMSSTSVSISAQGPPGTVSPGDSLCYQHWYRDPSGSPCGSNFNLSSALLVTWSL